MNEDREYQEISTHLAWQQLVAQYLRYWREFKEDERRKSPLLPVLWGHKGYSQNDEDGIIQEIFRRVGTGSRTFVEIGVGNGMQNNSLYWLKQGWRGAWVEGNGENARFIRQAFSGTLAQRQLHFQEAMVSAENINALIAATPFHGREIDLLSIDIDGNDYYVFERLDALDARVVIIEYNAKFPPPARWRVPYAPDFAWDGTDRFGASLQSMADLFEKRRYALVACNVTGSNAFFVRQDLVGDRFPCVGDIEKLYQPPRYFLTPGLFDHLGGSEISFRLDAICE